jgi:acetolactate synthase-1/2/3 large subunit
MNLQELQTLKQLNLNIILIILNNNGYLSIKTTQTNLCGGRLHLSNPASGLTLPNYCKIASAFELDYVSLNSLSEIPGLMQKIEIHRGPLVVEVMLDENAPHEPKIMTKIGPKGEFLSPDYGDIDWLIK